MKTLNLAGAWTLRNPRRKLEVPAILPGDTHSALLASGKIPDPFWADNESKLQWIGREDWTYEREFDVSAELLEEQSVFLNIENLDTMATLKINGRTVAATKNAFVRYRFEIKKFLKAGTNKITIDFASAVKAAKAEAAKIPYPVPHNKFDVFEPHRNFIRKVQCHSGWDWGPCLVVSGVHGAFYLGATSLARIDYVYTEQKHSAKGVEVIIFCEVESPQGGLAAFEVELDGQKKSIPVELKPGLNKLKQVVLMVKPKLWWPAGHGEQPLYDLHVRVGADAVKQRIGLRTIEVVNRDDKNGLSMEFVVNGVPIFCKGANWIPVDALPQRATREILDDLLTSAVAVHMNMLRVWGGGTYESDDFYDLCDEKGLMIWQDFMFACAMYPSSPEFLENVRVEARHQVKRLRHRACLALWCGNNEDIGAMTWFPETKANRDRYMVDYDRLNEGVLGDTARELDPTRMFWPSSPCGGPGDYSDCWHDDTRGDMHFWSVWGEGKPFEEFLKIKPRFCSEFGYQSFPSMEGIRSYASEDQFNVTSPILEYHQRHPAGNSIITQNMTRTFRFPEGFANFIYLSQVQQALAIKTAVEHFRALRPICMGALYWQLNDMWPVCSWASLEYGGKWKLLQYEAKHFFAPLLITTKLEGDSIEISAVSDLMKPVSAVARLRVIDFTGKVLKTIRISKRLPAGSSVLLKKIAVKQLVAEPNQAFLALDLTVGKEVVSNVHFFTPYKSCALAKAKIGVKAVAADGGFAVTLTTDAPAFWLRLDAVGIKGEFDDNGFTLLPGEPKILRFTPKQKVTLTEFREKLTLQHLRETYA